MSVSFVVVVPAIAEDLTAECLGSMAPELRAPVVLVDNTGTGTIAHAWEREIAYSLAPPKNLGVPASWNLGLRFAQHEQADYLILVSQSIRFGARSGLDFLRVLDERQPSMFLDAQFGWKLIAVRRERFAEVGEFDEHFTPGLYEESDWMYRAHLAGLCSPWYNDLPGREQVLTIDAESAGDAVAMRRGLVPGLDSGAQRAKYKEKWGGDPREETFTRPYNRSALDWRHTGGPKR